MNIGGSSCLFQTRVSFRSGFLGVYAQEWDCWVLWQFYFQFFKESLHCLEKTLESPLDCKEIQPVHPEGISPEYSLEGLMLKLKLQYFGHLMQRVGSFEKTLMLGKIEGRRRRGWQTMRLLDGITDSMDMGLGEFRELVMNREVWRAAVHGVTKNHTLLSELNWFSLQHLIVLQFLWLQLSSILSSSAGLLWRGWYLWDSLKIPFPVKDQPKVWSLLL